MFSLKKNISYLFPFYIVLIYYAFGFASIGEWVLILSSFFLFNFRFIKFRKLIALIIFIILYDSTLLLFGKTEIPTYFFNREIFTVIKLFCILIIVKDINYKKFRKSLNILTLITCAGVIYHAVLIYFGNSVSTISFYAFEDSRFNEVVSRPLSIFPEPAAIVSFLIIPLYLFIKEQKILLAVLLSIIILLTTSTTGLVYLFIFWVYFIFQSKQPLFLKLLFLVFSYFIFNIYTTNSAFEIFSQKGLREFSKIDNSSEEQLEDSIRLFSGPQLFSTLETSQLILGLRSPSIDYYVQNSSDPSLSLLRIEENVFLPSFWLIWASYGIIGLILYLNIFLYFFKMNKNLAPLILVLFAGMFVQKIGVGPVFIFYIVFLILETRNHKMSIQ